MSINPKSSQSYSSRLENILIIGSGGRENSLAWAIQKNELVKKVYLIPGNAGSLRINLGQKNLCKTQIFQLLNFGKSIL